MHISLSVDTQRLSEKLNNHWTLEVTFEGRSLISVGGEGVKGTLILNLYTKQCLFLIESCVTNIIF